MFNYMKNCQIVFFFKSFVPFFTQLAVFFVFKFYLFFSFGCAGCSLLLGLFCSGAQVFHCGGFS